MVPSFRIPFLRPDFTRGDNHAPSIPLAPMILCSGSSCNESAIFLSPHPRPCCSARLADSCLSLAGTTHMFQPAGTHNSPPPSFPRAGDAPRPAPILLTTGRRRRLRRSSMRLEAHMLSLFLRDGGATTQTLPTFRRVARNNLDALALPPRWRSAMVDVNASPGIDDAAGGAEVQLPVLR